MATQKFEELHISITPIKHEKYRYLVRTEESPKGVMPAEEQVIFPMEDWLAQARYLMDDSVAGLFHGYGATGLLEDDLLLDRPVNQDSGDRTDATAIAIETQTRSLVDLGREMYEKLFQGTLRDRLTSAIAIAHNQGSVLRLRLGLKDPILTRLPWEVLHEDTRPIATGKDIIFSRYQPTLSSLILPATPTGPLKILMVVAAPSDQDNLALKLEAKELKAELKRQVTSREWGNKPLPQIELDILEQPDCEKLTQVLEQNTYHVLHYAGHSNLGSQGGELYLVNQTTGLAEILNGDDLAGLLVNNGIHLAVFNSCRGADSAASIGQDLKNPRNLAEVLVNRGIPAVLAMAERIPDRVALTLTRLFYHNLKQGDPVDLSLNRARQGLVSTYGSNELYWALPVLYLHEKYQGYLTHKPVQDDGELFIPPRPVPKSGVTFSDVSGDGNGNGSGGPWRISHSELDCDPGDDELDRDRSDDEDDFFLEDDGEFMEDELGYDDDYTDYELEDRDRSDAQSLVSDIFSEFGFGQAGTSHPNAGESSSDDELFSNIDDPETALPGIQPSSGRSAERTQGDRGELSIASSPRTGNNIMRASESNQLNSNRLLKPPKTQTRFKWGIALVSFVGIALVVGAIGLWRSRVQPVPSLSTNQGTEETLPTPSNPSTAQPNPWENSTTPEVTAIAIENFSQGNLAQGVEAVNALLDRGALPQAKATLEAVPNPQKNTAEINFLQGRLAWQFVQTGNQDYSVSDARRYWDASAKSDPDSPLYANALAFAYYAEGNLELASNMWLQVVTLLEQTKPLPPHALTAHAGLSLVMMQQSRISKAVKQRNMVMNEAASDFQPDALAKNWMWSESAIADWQKLLQLEPSPGTANESNKRS